MGVRIWGAEITIGDVLIDITGSAISTAFVMAGQQTGALMWYTAALASGAATVLILVERQKRRRMAQAPRTRAHRFQHQVAPVTTNAVTARPPAHERQPTRAPEGYDKVLRVRRGTSKKMQHQNIQVVASYEEQVTVRVFHPRDPEVHAITLPATQSNTYTGVKMATGPQVLFRVAGTGVRAVFLHVVFQRTGDS